ncbi:MAG: 16S rRNA (uracil(1498)-N(3))-methyltransferase [Cyanobacteria bacterium P01_H01_bin.153]
MQRVIVDPAQIEADRLALTDAQRHYLRRVLRLKAGDRFWALDGHGQMWEATLQADGETALLRATIPVADSQLPTKPKITLAACLPKQGFDEVVRQVTELGVDEIVPILSERTLLKPSAHKLERWRRIVIEAGEQSERFAVPIIREPLVWASWLTRQSQDFRLICVARQPAPSLLSHCLSSQFSAIEVAIGPEGGWTEKEVTNAIVHGYQPVTLGSSILRAVTAPVVALGLLQAGIEFVTINQSTDAPL